MRYLYPKVVVERQSFLGVKREVVPNQSMSLKEILRRFVKREALPVARQGMYEERFGDLEKLGKADITVQMERIEELKADIAAFELSYQKKLAKAKEDAAATAAALAQAPATPAGGTPVNSPPLQGS